MSNLKIPLKNERKRRETQFDLSNKVAVLKDEIQL